MQHHLFSPGEPHAGKCKGKNVHNIPSVKASDPHRTQRLKPLAGRARLDRDNVAPRTVHDARSSCPTIAAPSAFVAVLLDFDIFQDGDNSSLDTSMVRNDGNFVAFPLTSADETTSGAIFCLCPCLFSIQCFPVLAVLVAGMAYV